MQHLCQSCWKPTADIEEFCTNNFLGKSSRSKLPQLGNATQNLPSQQNTSSLK